MHAVDARLKLSTEMNIKSSLKCSFCSWKQNLDDDDDDDDDWQNGKDKYDSAKTKLTNERQKGYPTGIY